MLVGQPLIAAPHEWSEKMLAGRHCVKMLYNRQIKTPLTVIDNFARLNVARLHRDALSGRFALAGPNIAANIGKELSCLKTRKFSAPATL
jgi:hypothetical protein